MKHIQFTVRLSPCHVRILQRLAEARQISRYAMLGQVIGKGLLAYSHEAERHSDSADNEADIASQMALLGERLDVLDHLIDRTLFVACASYTYARHGALGLSRDEAQIAADAKAAFERQRALPKDLS